MSFANFISKHQSMCLCSIRYVFIFMSLKFIKHVSNKYSIIQWKKTIFLKEKTKLKIIAHYTWYILLNDGQNFIYFMTLFNTIEHNSKFIWRGCWIKLFSGTVDYSLAAFFFIFQKGVVVFAVNENDIFQNNSEDYGIHWNKLIRE